MARKKLYKSSKRFSVRLTLKDSDAAWLRKQAKKLGGMAQVIRELIAKNRPS